MWAVGRFVCMAGTVTLVLVLAVGASVEAKRATGAGGIEGAPGPMPGLAQAYYEGAGCGWGYTYLGERASFNHPVDFTIVTGDGEGYLLDCYAGADAYLRFADYDGAYWSYHVWGQLGNYQ